MTQNIELLLKDICARLPYKVYAQIPDDDEGYISAIESVDIDGFVTDFEGVQIEIEKVKPYLLPLSSMTEEQHNEFFTYFHEVEKKEIETSGDYLKAAYLGENAKRDWLNKNHFDYHYLIEKGLAIDATGKNIY